MGYIDIGFNLGLLFWVIAIALITFNKTVRLWFYTKVWNDTLLGDAGIYLFFPENSYESRNTTNTLSFITLLILCHIGVLIILMIISILLGAILYPLLVIGAIIGLIVYKITKKKVIKE